MDSDTPTAAWHPAKMPNYDTGDHPAEVEPHTEVSAAPSQDDHARGATGDEPHDPAAADYTSGQHVPSEEPATQPSSHYAENGHYDHDEESGAALWDVEASAHNSRDSAQHQVDDAVASGSAAAPTSNTSKHLSTMSFARTVSHEVSFNDDEDVEWNLQRSETNPFSFMPENERTNSFPIVPQAEHPEAGEFSHLPHASQAGEIMQDLDAEYEHNDAVASETHNGEQQGEHAAENRGGEENGSGNVLGGDTMDQEQEDFEARYEEGLPLIPQQQKPQHPPMDSENKQADPTSVFSDDETGDDFFAQMQSDSRNPGDAPLKGTLQRKSTTMVIAESADSEPPSPVEEALSKELDVPNTGVNGESTHSPEGGARVTSGTEDIDAKWAAAFADDDDDGFLLDTTADAAAESKELDPADIFGSDDEGFLEDEDQAEATPMQTPAPQPDPSTRYAPTPVQQQAYVAPNPYAPAPAAMQMPAIQQRPQFTTANTAPAIAMGYGIPPPPKPEPPKAQSFVDKSKGGYQSPYDLPMEVVKPKKRASAQQLPRVNAAPSGPPTAPPPRSVSMYAQPPPSGGSISSLSPPGSSHSNQASSIGGQRPQPQPQPHLQSQSSFFEDLPITTKPRPSSRHASHGPPPQPTPPPSYHQGLPHGPTMGAPPAHPPPVSPPVRPQWSPTQSTGATGLVAPERVSPYSALQTDAPERPLPPATVSSRYSPAPANGALTAPNTSRYSPAPLSRSSSGNYSAVPPPVLPHLPRTSSPLAHFEVSSHSKSESKLGSPVNGGGAPLTRSSSSQYEPRVTRVPSLPPTQEVEEEQLLDPSPEIVAKAPAVRDMSRFAPSHMRQTPPPLGIHPSNPLSPPKRAISSYTPQAAANTPPRETNFVPPPRSQTQSPGALHGNRAGVNTAEPIPRPSSAHAPISPQLSRTHAPQSTTRARGMSQNLNYIPPTDGRELDPLQRWRGAPCFAWGVGGLFVTTFPKDVPRYGISSSVPQITRSPGEVKVKHMKDIQPLEERLAKFPGPLKGKSKKKEVLSWLTTGIDGLERTLPSVSFQQQVSHEDKRAVERLLLWKVLRILVEHDGVLEGNPAVVKAVRDVISPGAETASGDLSTISAGVALTGMATAASTLGADGTDTAVTESIRKHLLLGDREKAVWEAADKRLWGHALLLSSSMENPELYRQVTQEFIKKEVNHPGQGNESLAALYGVLSGNFEEAVDELVPVHARVGLQLMSTSTSGTSQDVLAGLDKWRETLGMILSNRRQGDGQALRSLGNLLSGYGRAEAAHICFIFARTFATFGGLDDPNANFVLVGADHCRQADQFAKETEALQLSEVYEYGLSLAPGSNVAYTCAHLAAYKLQHAMVLAEHGLRDKALQYCEGILSAITSQTKKSPYFNPVLETAVDDLTRRLKQAAGEESSSWITKPKMDQVSSNMWSRFSKFVAGPDDEGNGNGGAGENGADVGPFARIAGGTPTVSRSPSVSNFEVYGSSPSIPVQKTSVYATVGAQVTNSPYEPSGPYAPAPRTSMERTSGEIQRSSYDYVRRDSDMQSSSANPYAPVSSSSGAAYQPTAPMSPETSYMPRSQSQSMLSSPRKSSDIGYGGYQPFSHPVPESAEPNLGEASPKTAPQDQSAEQGYQSLSYGGYEPPSMSTYEPPATQEDTSTGGYEPPSYQPSGFEPPSYEPGPVDDDTENKPKKKSFMDDDDDDIPALRPREKTKAEKDRENEELVRRVAEEEEKRAAEAKAAKKSGWGFGGWFGGGKKEPAELPNKPIKAKLGEASSFVYDPELKRWVNKKPGAENTPAKTATPPPPRAASTPPTSTTSAPPIAISAPPPSSGTPPPMRLNKAISQESLNASGGAPLMARSISNQSNMSLAGGPPSAPPSRPATSLSNASSIDDLLGAAGSMRKGAKKPRKSGRYVDVMAK
ncbi:Sec23-binding domain of Sec16-domain-containing protein [Xylariaceae sp. FL0594]|nr:Sec23-binding domain of Sec16-domain-containing protein [Xylariaceae sp. FL0594]